MSKLIKIDEIAQFTGNHHTGYIEVPDWVRAIAVDPNGGVWGYNRVPELDRYTWWTSPLCIQMLPDHEYGEPDVVGWDEWYWEVPA